MAEDAAPPETLHHHSEMDGEGPNGGLQPLRVANHLNLGKKKKKWREKTNLSTVIYSTQL